VETVLAIVLLNRLGIILETVRVDVEILFETRVLHTNEEKK
jgi:hypothetical protein